VGSWKTRHATSADQCASGDGAKGGTVGCECEEESKRKAGLGANPGEGLVVSNRGAAWGRIHTVVEYADAVAVSGGIAKGVKVAGCAGVGGGFC